MKINFFGDSKIIVGQLPSEVFVTIEGGDVAARLDLLHKVTGVRLEWVGAVQGRPVTEEDTRTIDDMVVDFVRERLRVTLHDVMVQFPALHKDNAIAILNYDKRLEAGILKGGEYCWSVKDA